jgi:hypothetical protein
MKKAKKKILKFLNNRLDSMEENPLDWGDLNSFRRIFLHDLELIAFLHGFSKVYPGSMLWALASFDAYVRERHPNTNVSSLLASDLYLLVHELKAFRRTLEKEEYSKEAYAVTEE